jgi:hypothetical protein
MERSCQNAEYVICFVPYHQEVLSVHQSHFCLRVIVQDQGFQSDLNDIQRESKRICQNWQNWVISQLASVSLMDFALIQDVNSPMLPSASDLCMHNMTTYLGEEFKSNICNEYSVNNIHNVYNHKTANVLLSARTAPIYFIRSNTFYNM